MNKLLSSMFHILLISTYEMGRQPFGLASPAAWLRETGATVRCLDLAVASFDETVVAEADMVAFYVPMHTATRLAVQSLDRVRHVNPRAHICFYGLYAAENADYLHNLGVNTVLGGEFEAGLTQLAQLLAAGASGDFPSLPLICLDRQTFRVPDRAGLPTLDRYARLVVGDAQRVVGYVEASRGCKHLCRHCPIVPVYNGRFRLVQRDIVLADIRQQVKAGAQHITFGDPDFLNGPGHAIPLVEALHAEFPHLTYDVTIKVEHLLRHADLLPTLKRTGCLFITSAVESFDDHILTLFDKGHTRADIEAALRLCREVGLTVIPTFVAFTPWTTLQGYRHFLSEIDRLGLVDHVAPIQLAIRLLIPPGSRLLELTDFEALVKGLDPARLAYTWHNPDPAVDALQRQVERLAQVSGRHLTRRELFERVRELVDEADPAGREFTPRSDAVGRVNSAPLQVPYMSEPWYC